MTAKRLFVAIDPSAGIKRLLVELDPALPGMRWVRSEQMHLTLGFFPHVAAPAEESIPCSCNSVAKASSPQPEPARAKNSRREPPMPKGAASTADRQ